MPDNEIIEEGLNGRTLTSIDPIFKERCGIKELKMILMSHKPVDYVIVMLGTNELKTIFHADYSEASLVDNIYMDEENHIILAKAVNKKLNSI